MTRRRIGSLLRRYRLDAGMPSKDAARAADIDPTRLGRIEQGRYRITREQITSLMAASGIDDPEAHKELCRAAEESPNAGWWSPYRTHLPPAFADFIALESQAISQRVYHPVVIPGLLQTPGYVREIISRSSQAITPEQAEILVTVRLARQEVLTRTQDPVDFHALVPEAAFHARFESGQGVMRDQLRRLLDVSQQPNVTLQIVPLTAHPTYGSNGATTMLGFRHPWSTVVSVDNPMGGTHSDDPEEIAWMERVFAAAAEIALPVDKSRERITEYLEGNIT